MTAVLVGTPRVFAFNDGGSGKLLTHLDGAPAADQWDVLYVNSNTTVSTPSTAGAAWAGPNPSDVGAQGFYCWRRDNDGSEGASITVTTSGNENTVVIWLRFSNLAAVDQANDTTTGGTTTSAPPLSLAGLGAATENLIIAAIGMHNFAATPTLPVWSSGYSALAEGAIGTGGSAVAMFVGVRYDAVAAGNTGIGASWTNAAADRVTGALTFTTNPGTPGTTDGAVTGTLPALVGALAGDMRIDGTLTGTLPALVGALAGDMRIDGGLVGTLPAPTGRLADGSLNLPVESTRTALSTPYGTRIAESVG